MDKKRFQAKSYKLGLTLCLNSRAWSYLTQEEPLIDKQKKALAAKSCDEEDIVSQDWLIKLEQQIKFQEFLWDGLTIMEIQLNGGRIELMQYID